MAAAPPATVGLLDHESSRPAGLTFVCYHHHYCYGCWLHYRCSSSPEGPHAKEYRPVHRAIAVFFGLSRRPLVVDSVVGSRDAATATAVEVKAAVVAATAIAC